MNVHKQQAALLHGTAEMRHFGANLFGTWIISRTAAEQQQNAGNERTGIALTLESDTQWKWEGYGKLLWHLKCLWIIILI